MRISLALPLSLLLLIALGSAAAFGADLVGPESCKECHREAYQAWKGSEHARAEESLTKSQQGDRRCLACHAPEKDQKQDAVSCESCHGGGKHYSARYVMKDAELARATGLVIPDANSCAKCHDKNAPSLRPFVYKERLERIDHWSAERKKREAKAGAKDSGGEPQPQQR